MKRVLIVMALISVLVTPLTAQKSNFIGNIGNAIHRAAEKAKKKTEAAPKDIATRSQDAHNKASFSMEMAVRSRFVNQIQEEDNVVKKHCAAVKIDNNWLIASLRCRGTADLGSAMLHEGTVLQKEIAYRKIDWMKVEGVKVSPKDYFISEKANIILIRVSNNAELVKKIGKKGNIVANLLIAENPKKLTQAVSKAYMNRNRCPAMFGRCSDEVSIPEYCNGDKCYRVDWELIRGDSGDPLFFLSKNHGTAEFLAGLNDAENTSGYDTASKFYRVFDNTTWEFIESTIKPSDVQAFQRIQSHVFNEYMF